MGGCRPFLVSMWVHENWGGIPLFQPQIWRRWVLVCVGVCGGRVLTILASVWVNSTGGDPCISDEKKSYFFVWRIALWRILAFSGVSGAQGS